MSDQQLGTCDADRRGWGSKPHVQNQNCENWRPNEAKDHGPNYDYLARTGLKSDPWRDFNIEDVPMAPRSGEVRVTDPETGGEKGAKPQRMSLVPTDVLLILSEHYAKGAEKYDDHNWRRGYKWSLSYDALLRHLFAFWGGELIDPETQSPHLAAVLFHAAALLHYSQNGKGTDDRPPR